MVTISKLLLFLGAIYLQPPRPVCGSRWNPGTRLGHSCTRLSCRMACWDASQAEFEMQVFWRVPDLFWLLHLNTLWQRRKQIQFRWPALYGVILARWFWNDGLSGWAAQTPPMLPLHAFRLPAGTEASTPRPLGHPSGPEARCRGHWELFSGGSHLHWALKSKEQGKASVKTSLHTGTFIVGWDEGWLLQTSLKNLAEGDTFSLFSWWRNDSFSLGLSVDVRKDLEGEVIRHQRAAAMEEDLWQDHE